MTATNEQIEDEAHRRFDENPCTPLAHYIIEVTREGWTPPEPVDPEPEMTKTAQEHAAAMFATAIKPEPDLITLRLECLKLAVRARETVKWGKIPPSVNDLADSFLHYVLNGSVDKA
jgi:hypothetical protein